MNRILKMLFFILLAGNAAAQNYFSGTIERDTRWMGDIYIDGDVTIPRGVILSIESGSRIYIKPHTDVLQTGLDRERVEIVVNGVLLAKGSSEQSPVLFTSEASEPQMNDWYGILIKNFYNRSVLQNCIIEFGYKGITCYGSNPRIEDCEIRFHYNSGISCEVRAAPEIKSSVIMGNGFAGINCELASRPVISGTTVTQNPYGVMIFSHSEPDMGRYPAKPGQSSGENRIYNNFDYDIYNHSSKNIYAQNNFWNTTNSSEIRFSLYGNLKNPAYGQIIFEPIFFRKSTRYFPPASVALQPKRVPASETAEIDSPEPAVTDTMPQAKNSLLPDTLETPPVSIRPSADTVVKVLPETVFVYKEPQPDPVPPAPEPSYREPLLEAFLDAGKREYLRKVKPEYPGIYKKTGQEGDVLIEVVVSREGKVEDYRVLRSDGELFTESAIRALKRFRYKPGTLKGKPVQYKIVERFRFKRRSAE